MKDLTIPEKISLEKSIGSIRYKDIKKLIAMAVPGTVIGIAVWASTGDKPLVQFITMLSIMGYLFLCYVIVARIEGTPSILNFFELLIRFQREQQRFYYKQGKEKLYDVSDQTANGSPEADGTGIY